MQHQRLSPEVLADYEAEYPGEIRVLYATGGDIHFRIRGTEWRFRRCEQGYITRYFANGPYINDNKLFALCTHKADELMSAIVRGYQRGKKKTRSHERPQQGDLFTLKPPS
jgi:hypothetical protein